MFLRRCFPLLLWWLLALTAAAQIDSPPVVGAFVPATGGWGPVTNLLPTAATTTPWIVRHPGAAWLRLWFDDAPLPPPSFLRIRSLQDAAVQEIDAAALSAWRQGSAFFNGDAVSIELVVAPGATAAFALTGYDAGFPAVAGSDTICGPTDDRVPTTQPRVGRVLSGGGGSVATCSGALVSASSCFLTAGHCVLGASQLTVEFHVPSSTAGGVIVHPPPADQYPVDFATLAYSAGAAGDDWALARLLPNATNPAGAAALQGFFDLSPAMPVPGVVTRVTGFGNAAGTLNQTNQTAVGPFQSFGVLAPLAVEYLVDTTGGNSGSPLIEETTQRVIGVHTTGTCTVSSGTNQGTAIVHPGLRAHYQAISQTTFAIAVSQGGLGLPIVLTVANAPAGSELFNVVSFLPAAPTDSGPFFGLAVGPGSGDLFALFTLPLGSQPFHVLADPAGAYSITINTAGAGPAFNVDIVSLAFGAGLGFGAWLGRTPAVNVTFSL